MTTVNNINLLNFEFQDVNELNDEELEAVAGGYSWGEFKEGARDFLQGTNDGLNGRDTGESNFNYLGGQLLGSGGRVAADVVGGKGK